MMRPTLIGLSFLFFTLTVIIIIKASQITSHQSESLINQNAVPTEPNDILRNLVDEQTSSNPVAAPTYEVFPLQLESDSVIQEQERITEYTQDTEIEVWPKVLTVFGGATFSSGQDTIHNMDKSTIEDLIGKVSQYPDARIIIEGHTDNIPTGRLDSDNMDLSLRRAKAIANILISHGIQLERISVIGHGDTRPIASNETKEGRADNRRVEVKLMPEEKGN